MEKSTIFKLVWRGWFVGASILFIPFFLFIVIFGQNIPIESLLAIPLIPIITAVQGIFVGALVLLGVIIWPPKLVT